MATKKNNSFKYIGPPKECSICGNVFYGKDATEGKTGPIICIPCWMKMEMENTKEREKS